MELVELECVNITCANGPNGIPGFWVGLEGDVCPLCGAVGKFKPPPVQDPIKIKP
jgi:hypothetical protein